MPSGYVEEWARAFALTLVIEVPLYMGLLRREGFTARSAFGAALAVNACSHPLFWFALPPFAPEAAFLAVGEMLVVAVETAILYAWATYINAKRRFGRLLFIVLVVNAVSMGVGMAMLRG